MRGCLEDGAPCRLSFHDNPKRKLKWSLEQICVDGLWIMVNTAKPNHVVSAAIQAGDVPELRGYGTLERERSVGNSRIDIRLSNPSEVSKPVAWVEVKNATLREANVVLFPDSVTVRGTKHLVELEQLVRGGERGVLFFHVGTQGVDELRPAQQIDPVYAETLERAAEAGVEILAYRCEMDAKGLWLADSLPVCL
jgi:sugar fermentation stimulation protein A